MCDERVDDAADRVRATDERTYSTYEECLEAISAEGIGYESSDPRSVYYNRIVLRPKISIIKAILNVAVPVAAIVLLCFLLWLFEVHIAVIIISGAAALLLYIALRTKSIIIWLIKVYQAVAPKSVRERCRYEPSCSTYMILSLEKYGLFKGLKKGIDRLKRCREPNGGYDPVD